MGDERKKTVDPDGVKGSVLLHADVMVKEHHTTTTETKPHPPVGSQKLEGAEHDIVVRECTASAPALFKRLVKHVLNVVCLLVLLYQMEEIGHPNFFIVTNYMTLSQRKSIASWIIPSTFSLPVKRWRRNHAQESMSRVHHGEDVTTENFKTATILEEVLDPME